MIMILSNCGMKVKNQLEGRSAPGRVNRMVQIMKNTMAGRKSKDFK